MMYDKNNTNTVQCLLSVLPQREWPLNQYAVIIWGIVFYFYFKIVINKLNFIVGIQFIYIAFYNTIIFSHFH